MRNPRACSRIQIYHNHCTNDNVPRECYFLGMEFIGVLPNGPLRTLEEEEEEEEKKKRRRKRKIGFIYEEIINFQQIIRYKGVFLREDWKIINQLLVSSLQEDGPG